tara:strand:+ start:776 stop:931 length:156 start_codon:yes stop_codon:yes gene_type:complete
MLRMMTISNDLLRYLVKVINRDIAEGKEIKRSTLSNAIWNFEKGLKDEPNK